MLCRSGDAAPENACVSVEEEAEKARCYGGTFGSWLERWQLSPTFWVEVGTQRLKACVSPCREG